VQFDGEKPDKITRGACACNDDEVIFENPLIEIQTGGLDAAVADFAKAASIAPSPIACYWLVMALERKGEP
jgi:hypothetical protein